MAAKIWTRENTHHNKINITSVEYPERIDVEATPPGPRGKELPSAMKFSANFEPPGVSFKTYRALVNNGLSSISKYVLQKRKRSFITANHIWNGVMGFSSQVKPRTNLPAYYKSLEKLRSQFNVEEKIPILSMDDAISGIPRSTSPGLPWIITHPGLKKGDVLDDHLLSIKLYWRGVARGIPSLPLPDCAAFARSHISDPAKNKVRAVWAMPITAICQEARFSIPITNLLKQQKIFTETAYGMEMMKGGMAWLNQQMSIASLRNPGCKFASVDYSAFDSSIPAWMIRDSFSIIREKFDFSKMQVGDAIVEVDVEEQENQFRKMVHYFINTPIRNSDGRRFQKDHGVPSGSMFTNIIDTMVNYLATQTLCELVFEQEPLITLVFGDDTFLTVRDTCILDLQAYAETAQNIFGLTVNVGKSVATRNPRNVHFLGYFNYGGTPIKNPVDLIASMLYPQHEKDDWAYCISRALGCLLASAGTSTEVYLAARSVWMYASRNENAYESLEKGIMLLQTNPRSRRFLDQMGCGDLKLGPEYFEDINMSIPRFNCSKNELGVNVVR